MRHVYLGQALAQMFRRFHRTCTDQHRLPGPVNRCNAVHNALPLGVLIKADNIFGDHADYFLGRRNSHHIHAIDRPDFPPDFGRGPGHARQIEITFEEALIADTCQRVLIASHLTVFLQLHHLMQPAFPISVWHQAPCKLINDLYLTVGDKILTVTHK